MSSISDFGFRIADWRSSCRSRGRKLPDCDFRFRKIRNPQSAIRNQPGFTLVEVLVALAIFALGAVVLGSAYLNVLNSYEAVSRGRAMSGGTKSV